MLHNPAYVVYLPEGREVTTEITHGDMLRGEFEANKQGLPAVKEAPMNHTTVWLWCALTRLGEYGEDYRTFKAELLGIESVKDASGEATGTDVDPTRPTGDTPSP
jgi:hypothetical protein